MVITFQHRREQPEVVAALEGAVVQVMQLVGLADQQHLDKVLLAAMVLEKQQIGLRAAVEGLARLALTQVAA